MKTIGFLVMAEVPDNVKEHRVEAAIVSAVTKHVVPDYSTEAPKVSCNAVTIAQWNKVVEGRKA